MSTAADPAQALLKPIRFATIEANAALPRRATMNRHGCELLADGDQRAASRAAVSLVSSTDASGSNAARAPALGECGQQRRTVVSAVRLGVSAMDIGLLGFERKGCGSVAIP